MFSIARIVAFTVTAVSLASAAPANEVVSGLTKRVVYSCSDSAQDAFATASYSEAQTLAANAASYIATNGADSLFQTYFGASTSTVLPQWVYNQISTEDGTNFTINCAPTTECGSNIIADTAWGDTKFTTTHSDGTKTVTIGNYHATTYLCPLFYDRAPLASLCTGASGGRADSLVHEMSHAFAHTKDYVYGCANTRALAISNPAEAANNAENFGCFSIAAYQATQCS
ncbi:hypothetical protein C8F04DRAFT_1406460 [Mycena alexandri]|uniref:Lysine-specific metallo-endopeptidase domain-containing protein n=1 Tax=Mycena alexandri TaxID=1745969 RepID=A0AAD6S126_9AGAR|nr:hypothetical protein C8F04DRAFT_1406460 [Mycena alexandri]